MKTNLINIATGVAGGHGISQKVRRKSKNVPKLWDDAFSRWEEKLSCYLGVLTLTTIIIIASNRMN